MQYKIAMTRLLAALLFFASSAMAQTIEGRASVIDGDTIEISGERIRLNREGLQQQDDIQDARLP